MFHRFTAAVSSVALTVSLVLSAMALEAPTARADVPSPEAPEQLVGQIAAANLGHTACGPNSEGSAGFETSCTGAGGQPELWCADFAIWVWHAAGAVTGGLNAAAASFAAYGIGSTPHVGDAVLFDYNGSYASHVAIVVDVLADGTIKSIGGDEFGDTSGTDSHYAATAKVAEDTYPATVNKTVVVSGAPHVLSGFVSPRFSPGLPNVGHPPGTFGTVQTGGITLNERSCPSVSCGVVGGLPDGSQVEVYCQENGDPVTGNWGSTKLWDEIQAGGNVFVSDGYVFTGSNGAVAPDCSSTSNAPPTSFGAVQTGGVVLNVRSCASVGCPIVDTVPDGSQIPIYCQKSGDVVSGNWGQTDLWDEIRSTGNAFVSDGYIYTGSNGAVAPAC